MHKKAQYLLASIVESSQDSIVSIDLDRNVTSWNRSAEVLYGYKGAEVIGKPLSVVMLPEDIKALIDKVNDIIHEVTVPVYETVRVHKNGRQTELEILLSPVRNALGEVIGVSTVARDITIRKMQGRQKDEFIAIASHELKSPVTSIKAYAEILHELLERSGDKDKTSVASKLCTQLDRLAELINTLLDTTKLAAGEILMDVEQFDLNGLIKEQIRSLSYLSGNHKLAFQPGGIPPLWGDRKLIGRVVSNIITNAVKYSPSGGDVIIATTGKDKAVEVSVQDFGVGIPAEVKHKIFERYFRARSTQTAGTSGIGLGLYITAGLVHQHGGTISVESEEGKGSTFFFTLPYGR